MSPADKEKLAECMYRNFYRLKKSDEQFSECGDNVRRVWLELAESVYKEILSVKVPLS